MPGRVTHAALNKDNGLIDPDTGDTTEPTTLRGMVGENFSKAVAGASRRAVANGRISSRS